MSWLRDQDEDLINLEMACQIEVSELSEPEEGLTHCVVARFQIVEDRIVFTGTEAECTARRDLIATKLPMVRL